MANHGKIELSREVAPEEITKLLNELKETEFKNAVDFEYAEGDERSWGPAMWFARQVTKEGVSSQVIRVMWLNPDNSFEMRHGGGSDWAWWVDETVQAHVQKRFGGIAFDDGVEGPIALKIQTFGEHLKHQLRKFPKENYAWLVQKWESLRKAPHDFPEVWAAEVAAVKEHFVLELARQASN
jgi:hypothetical protein